MRVVVIGCLLVYVIAAAGCGNRVAPEPSNGQLAVQSRVTNQPPKPSPKLWLDDQAADMFKAVLGNNQADTVYVIRWENCEQLGGWIKLDAMGRSEPVSYDLTIHPKDISLALKHRQNGLSGWLVVAMSKLPGTPGEAYEVHVEQGFTQQYVSSEGHDKSQASQATQASSQEHESYVPANEIISQKSRFKSRRGRLLRVPPEDAAKDSARGTCFFSGDGIELQKSEGGRLVSWLRIWIGAVEPKDWMSEMLSKKEATGEPSPPPIPTAKPVPSGESSSPSR